MRPFKKAMLHTGNVCYTVSFKWFDSCNLPPGCSDWKWYHKVLFMIGTVGVVSGVLFHVIAGDEYEASKR